jgi:RimJ/RimL family protein N-acetyltransferase
MAVLSDFHGRGVGSQLLDSLERWARATGPKRIELTVMAHNHRAIRLYERAGFVTEGLKRAAIVVDGVAVDEVMMGKALHRDRPPS